MKPTTIVLLVVFILILYYYTAETYDVVKIVGHSVVDFVGNVGSEVVEHSNAGKYDEVKKDITNVYEEIVEA